MPSTAAWIDLECRALSEQPHHVSLRRVVTRIGMIEAVVAIVPARELHISQFCLLLSGGGSSHE